MSWNIRKLCCATCITYTCPKLCVTSLLVSVSVSVQPRPIVSGIGRQHGIGLTLVVCKVLFFIHICDRCSSILSLTDPCILQRSRQCSEVSFSKPQSHIGDSDVPECDCHTLALNHVTTTCSMRCQCHAEVETVICYWPLVLDYRCNVLTAHDPKVFARISWQFHRRQLQG